MARIKLIAAAVVFSAVMLLSCQMESSRSQSTYDSYGTSYDDDFDEAIEKDVSSDRTYHTNSEYKYEYRTGQSGNYTYNYDIEGYSYDGDYVYGNIDITDKYGDGYIYDEWGNEKYIEVEWVDYGVLEGYDEDGNYYELEAE